MEKYKKMSNTIYDAAVRNFFSPEFRNRITATIVYDPILEKTMNKLVNKAEKGTRKLVQQKYGLGLKVSDAFKEAAKKNGFDLEDDPLPAYP